MVSQITDVTKIRMTCRSCGQTSPHLRKQYQTRDGATYSAFECQACGNRVDIEPAPEIAAALRGKLDEVRP